MVIIVSKAIHIPKLFPGKSQNIDQSLDEIHSDVDFDFILELFYRTSLKGLTLSRLNQLYFSYARIDSNHLFSGIIETPEYIAQFMVAEAINISEKRVDKLSWYDPCCGSGVFVNAIISETAERSEGNLCSYSQLPTIYASELSPQGIFITVCTLEVSLAKYGLNVGDYIATGKLKLYLGDSLYINPEAQLLTKEDNLSSDIVIGNPPYVRSTRLTKEYKMLLSRLYPSSYAGNADLYTYFIANAINSLNDSGFLCFISPANFFRSSAGRSIRQFVQNRSIVHTVIDLDELPIFPDADVHSAIYIIKESRSSKSKTKKYRYRHFEKREDLAELKRKKIAYCQRTFRRFSQDGWIFENPEEKILFDTFEERCIPLADLGFKIYSGVRSGYQKAFIYDPKKLDNIDPELISEWFKPSLGAKEIVKWLTLNTISKYLLFIPPRKTNIPLEIIDLLLPHKEKLLNRHEVGDKIKWHQLRPCTYYHLMGVPKIVFPDISSAARFSIDYTQKIILDGAFFIPTGDLSLLGILNSNIAWTYFKNYCSSIGNAKNKGRVRLKKSILGKISIAKKLF